MITFLQNIDKGIAQYRDFYYKEECTKKDIATIVQVSLQVHVSGRPINFSLYYEKSYPSPTTTRAFFKVGANGGDWYLRNDREESHTLSSSWGDSRTVNDIISLCNLEPQERFTNLITYVDKWMRDRADLLSH